VKSGVTSVTVNGWDTQRTILLIEYSGANTSTPLDTGSTSNCSNTGTTATSNSITTGTANEVLIGYFFNQDNSQVFTLGSGYSNMINQSAWSWGIEVGSEDRFVTSTGTYTTSAGGVSNGQVWCAFIMGFK
jgi:hypothetical protein